MNTTPSPFDLTLAHKAMFSVSDASGVQIACRTGSLWITLDDDPRDVVLDAGDSFLTTEHRRALIYAMEESSLSLAMTPAVAPKGSARRGWVATEGGPGAMPVALRSSEGLGLTVQPGA